MMVESYDFGFPFQMSTSHWRNDRKQLRDQPRKCAPESEIRFIFNKEETFDSKGRSVFRPIRCRRLDDNVEVVTESWVVARRFRNEFRQRRRRGVGFVTCRSCHRESPTRAPYGLRIIESCKTGPLTKKRQFCNLPPKALEEIGAISSSATYPKGAILFVEGQESRGVFVICHGRVMQAAFSRIGLHAPGGLGSSRVRSYQRSTPDARCPECVPPARQRSKSAPVRKPSFNWFDRGHGISSFAQDLVRFSITSSMINFGTIRPKLIATIMRTATEPSANVAPMSAHVICELLVSCTRPLAILNMKTPGIIDTTDANPMAANGMCQRYETGVRITPTITHAINAPVGALTPSAVSASHLKAWATAPTATGQGASSEGR